MNQKEGELLAAIHQELKDHIDTTRQYRIDDREDRRKWRDEVQQDIQKVNTRVEAVEESISPIVGIHKFTVNLLKFTGASGAVTGIVWVWHHLKDNLKP